MANKIKLYNGIMFDPFRPKAEDIDIVNIAHGLSREPRFSGQNPGLPYTVAQHSVLTSYNCRQPYQLDGLLHDFPEGLGLRDIASPLKKHWTMRPYRRAENRLLRMGLERYECHWPLHDEVHRVDAMMFEFEKEALWGGPVANHYWCIEGPNGTWMRDPKELEVWSPARAEHEFLVRFAELTAWRVAPLYEPSGMVEAKWLIRKPRPKAELIDLKEWGKAEWPEVNYE